MTLLGLPASLNFGNVRFPCSAARRHAAENAFTGANAARQSTKRTASYAPCTKDQFEQWTRSEDIKTDACKRVLDAKYQPYVDMSPVQRPSGDIITPLSGPAQGYLAVLNPVGLTEKHRLKLARCP
jgi:hypothetical protein